MKFQLIMLIPVIIVSIFFLFYKRRRYFYIQDFRQKAYEVLKYFLYPSAFNLQLNDIFLPSTRDVKLEEAKLLSTNESDNLLFVGVDGKGFRLGIKITRFSLGIAEAHLSIRVPGDTVYTVTNQTSKVSGVWSAGSLQFELNEPMKSWRISFNGSVRSSDNSKHHIKLNTIWTAFCKPTCYKTTCNLSSNPQNDKAMWGEQKDGYEQWGSVIGTIKIGNNSRKLHLMSLRQRFWGNRSWSRIVGFSEIGTMYSVNLSEEKEMKREIRHTWNFKNIQKIAIAFINNLVKRLHSSLVNLNREIFGQIRYPNGKEIIVSKSVYQLNSPACQQLQFSAGRKKFSLYAQPDWRTNHSSKHLNIQSFDGFLSTDLTEGFKLDWNSYCSDKSLNQTNSSFNSNESSEILLVNLHSPLCKSMSLVGGKAASLAVLSEVQSKSQYMLGAKVPKGFCLTKSAMELQINSSRDLKAILKTLAQDKTSDIEENCKRIQNLWQTTKVCTEIQYILDKHIENGVSYAVRSSGLTEDTFSASSAGQNSSFLGCIGLDCILKAVQRCWASLYSFHSVQYRRIQGLPMRSTMGIIIQKMVPAEIAGVMFTCDPVTGDQSSLIITANYGLGETVVSGAVEPDTIKLARSDSRTDSKEDPVTVISEECGKKTHQLAMAVDGIVLKLNLNDTTANEICISPNEARLLAKIGIQLEKEFGSPCDIEWAMAKDQIYLLQCRPITTLHTWTDEELLHEFDSAILPTEVVSTANTGEVLPKATSILSQSLLVKAIDVAIQLMKPDYIEDFYNNNTVIMSQHHALLNVMNTLLDQIEEKRSIPQLAIELAVSGHTVTDDYIQKVAVMRNGVASNMKKLKAVLKAVQSMCWAETIMKEAEEYATNFSIAYKDCSTSMELFNLITDNLDHLMQAALRHSLISAVNVFWQIIILTILLEGEMNPTTDHLEDVCKILRSCRSVTTVEIPSDLEEISQKISECENSADFCSMPPNLAKNWIKIYCPQAAHLLSNFLITYGHRSIKEMDFYTETWGLNSTPLLLNLQTLVRGKNSKKIQSSSMKVSYNAAEDKVDIIGELKTPKKFSTRSALRWIVPLCNKTSGWREITKDALLLVIHMLRSSYHQLGNLMARENYIPQPKLVFFCTHYEIKKLLESRNSEILQKSLRRQRLYPQWAKIDFPEIAIGVPHPLESAVDARECDGGACVKGTLVFPGKIEGRACVVINLEDSSEIQAGDILITKSTDIGWSPLFPLVGGIVTELGGLISHGAVVAREFGVPSLVGAVSATSVFRTGDKVVLDGASGVVYRVT